MKKALKIIVFAVGIILLIAVVGYFIWFHNTKEHLLKLQASEIYSPTKSNSFNNQRKYY